jgi:3-deoxy-D-manno-octulosonate 8-phosphate phosphatase (KDO 8-P phosphatase)
MLQAAGVETAILSGRDSGAVVRRAAELSIRHVVQGAGDKNAAFDELLSSSGYAAADCSFMGDDLPDLPVLRRCGFAVAVANAVDAVKAAAHYVTLAPGGHGAAREFCDLVIAARAQLASAQAV